MGCCNQYSESNHWKKVKTLPTLDRVGDFYVIETKPDKVKTLKWGDKVGRNMVSGTFQSGKVILGVLISHGKIIADRVPHRPPRACLVIDKGKAYIRQAVAKASDLGPVDYAIGGMALLPELRIEEEEIQADIANSSRPRHCVGINSQGYIVDVTTESNKTLKQMQEIMLRLDCKEAINLDGGGTTQLDWLGQDLIKSNRIAASVIKFEEE